MKVFKQKLEENHGIPCTLKLPYGARILHAGMQFRDICVWYVCDPASSLTDRTFIVYGTGHEMKEDEYYRHVNTIQDGPFVWHVFEVLEVA